MDERKDISMRAIVLGATVVAVFSLCCSERGWAGDPVNPNLSAEGRQVLDYLDSTYQKQVLAGYNVYVHTPDDYEQTGKQAAIWGRDIRWLGDVREIAQHAKRLRYILTLHWHWHFDEDSAWTGKRKTPADVGKIITPGTTEHKQAIARLPRWMRLRTSYRYWKMLVFRCSGVPCTKSTVDGSGGRTSRTLRIRPRCGV